MHLAVGFMVQCLKLFFKVQGPALAMVSDLRVAGLILRISFRMVYPAGPIRNDLGTHLHSCFVVFLNPKPFDPKLYKPLTEP